MSLILPLSWFQYGHPPVSSTGAFRLYLSQGVTAVVHGFTVRALDPTFLGGKGVVHVDCNAVYYLRNSSTIVTLYSLECVIMQTPPEIQMPAPFSNTNV